MDQETLLKELETQRAENVQLRQELARAQAQLAELTIRIHQLEGQRAKDSHNSSKPPSSDGPSSPVRRTKSLREKGTKKRGGQPGHPGHTLQMAAEPHEVVVLTPEICEQCHGSLRTVPVIREERAQVWDLPEIRLQVKQYQAQVKCCPNCQSETRAAFPAGVKAASVHYGPMIRAWAVYLQCVHLLPHARTCQVLSDLLATSFSQASLQAALQEGSQGIEPALALIKEGLLHSPVLHTDETGFRIGAQRLWLHVATTTQLTYYQAHRNRGKAACDAIGILPQFQGVSMHDSLVSYLQYPCEHALCNAHYVRELTYIHEQYEQDWAKALKDLLLEIKVQAEQARGRGDEALPLALRTDYQQRYEHLVEVALQDHPPPERAAGTRGRPRRGDEVRNLLCRLHDYQPMILRFLHQLNVPFDNNLAEQAIRMMKVQQKVSGGFRTSEGATIFCRLRSYLSTMHKQGVHLLTALFHLFLGSPLLPSLGG